MATITPTAPPPANRVQTNTPTPAAPTATPAKKGGPPKKDKYPIPEGGLDGLPEDYNREKFAVLGKKDFSKESVYWDVRAYFASQDAESHKEMANSHRRLETLKGNVKAARLFKLEKEISKLREQLLEQGDDPDAILQTANA